MKTILITTLLFLIQLTTFSQRKDESWNHNTQYGKLKLNYYVIKKSQDIIPTKLTFTPKPDDNSLDYTFSLFQRIQDKSLDSIILSYPNLIKHFPRGSKPDSQDLYTSIKKLEKVLVDTHSQDLENSIFLINPNIHTTPKPKTLMRGETYPYHQAIIEKAKYDADNLYYLHFPEKIKPSNFNKNIPGVESIWQQSPEPFSENKHQYSIIVEIGLAFNQLEVLKKIIDSKR